MRTQRIFKIFFLIITLGISTASTTLDPKCTIRDFIHFKKIQLRDSSYLSNFQYKQTKSGLITYFSLCRPLPEEAFKLCGIKKDTDIFFIEVRHQTCDTMRFSKLKEITYQDKLASLTPKINFLEIFNHQKKKQITLEFFAHGQDYEIIFPEFGLEKASYEQKGQTVVIKIPGIDAYDVPNVKGGYLWTNEFTFYWWGFHILNVSGLMIGLLFYKMDEGDGCLKPFNFCVFYFTGNWILDFLVQTFGWYEPWIFSITVPLISLVFTIVFSSRTESKIGKFMSSKNLLYFY